MKQKSIKKNAAYNAIKTVFSSIYPLITVSYISRVLLKENVGRINFSLSIISYFSLIATLGITAYAVRECSAVRADQDKLNDTSSQIFSINVFSTAVAYLLLMVLLLFYGKIESYRSLILVLSMSILFTTVGADWLNTAMEDFWYITLCTVGVQLFSLVLMFVFVHKPEDYMRYALISVISTSGASITNIWYRKRYCRVRFTLHIDWKKHMKPIVLMFVMLLSQNILSNVDITMLGLMQGDAAVGVYTTAQKIYSFVSTEVGSILWVVMPRMSLYFSEEKYDLINKLSRRVLGFFLLVGLPCVTGMFTISKDIILVVAGVDYLDAAIVLQVLAISFLISLFAGGFFGNIILLPANREKYCMIVTLVDSGINICANYVLIPKYGAVGAAVTTTLCTLCSLVLYAWYMRFKFDGRFKLERISWLVVTPVVGCVAIFGVCNWLSTVSRFGVRVVASISLSAIVYAGIQVLLRNELAIEAVSIGYKKLKRKDD